MEASDNEDDNAPTRHHMLSNKTSKPGMEIHLFRSLAKRGPVDTHPKDYKLLLILLVTSHDLMVRFYC